MMYGPTCKALVSMDDSVFLYKYCITTSTILHSKQDLNNVYLFRSITYSVHSHIIYFVLTITVAYTNYGNAVVVEKGEGHSKQPALQFCWPGISSSKFWQIYW